MEMTIVMLLIVSFDKFFNSENYFKMTTTSSIISLSRVLFLWSNSTNDYKINVLFATFSANTFDVPVMLWTKKQIEWNIFKSRKSELISVYNSLFIISKRGCSSKQFIYDSLHS